MCRAKNLYPPQPLLEVPTRRRLELSSECSEWIWITRQPQPPWDILTMHAQIFLNGVFIMDTIPHHLGLMNPTKKFWTDPEFGSWTASTCLGWLYGMQWIQTFEPQITQDCDSCSRSILRRRQVTSLDLQNFALPGMDTTNSIIDKPSTKYVNLWQSSFLGHHAATSWGIRAGAPEVVGTSKLATSKSMSRARLPSIFITSHKMPPLPRNVYLVATWRSPDNAIRKKHATRHV